MRNTIVNIAYDVLDLIDWLCNEHPGIVGICIILVWGLVMGMTGEANVR